MDTPRGQATLEPRHRVLVQEECSCPGSSPGTGRDRDLSCVIHGTEAMTERRKGWARQLDPE